MTLLVPEDLKESHAYFVDKTLNHVSVSTDGLYMVQLFARIGRVEHERNQLRATRLEDALTIANQRTLLDKYDANNTALMAREKLLKDALRGVIQMGERHGCACGYCRDGRHKAITLLAQFDTEDHR